MIHSEDTRGIISLGERGGSGNGSWIEPDILPSRTLAKAVPNPCVFRAEI